MPFRPEVFPFLLAAWGLGFLLLPARRRRPVIVHMKGGHP